MDRANASRPAETNHEAAEHVSAGDFNGASTIARTTDDRDDRRAGVIQLSRRRDFYVRVYSVRRDGIVAVQVFADLRSAERKVDRVRAAGLACRMELIRVVAVQPLDPEGGDLR